MFIGTMTRDQVVVELIATKAALHRVENTSYNPEGPEGVVWLDLKAKVAALEAALAAVNSNHECGYPCPRLRR